MSMSMAGQSTSGAASDNQHRISTIPSYFNTQNAFGVYYEAVTDVQQVLILFLF